MPPETSQLPGVLWDPRVHAWRAPAYRYRELVEELRRHHWSFIDRVRNGPRHRRYRAPVPRLRRLSLRPYQLSALLAWQLAGHRGLVVLPTGAGKTRVAIAAAQRLACSCIILVPTRVLMEQWLLQLQAAGCADPGCFGDGRHELRPWTVATFESAWRRMDSIGERFNLLVVDEVHHFGTGARDEALEMCVAGARLGLTATPPAPASLSVLRNLIGPVVCQLGISDLAGSYLAPFDLATLTIELNREERSRYEARMACFHRVYRAFCRELPEASWVDFVRVAARTQEGRLALRGLREARALLSYPEAKDQVLASLLLRHREDRVLIFTADNETAYRVARRFLVMPITCDISRPERAQALARFREGTLRALVSSRVLNEGIDVPAAEIGIVVGAAQGEREHAQRVGRLLRPAAGKRAIVYELVVAQSLEVRSAQRRRRGLAPRLSASL